MKNKQSAAWYLVVVEIIVLILVVVCVVWRWIRPEQESGEWIERSTEHTEMLEEIRDTEVADVETPVEEQSQEFSDDIKNKLDEMTLEEKVAQMFLITPEELTGINMVNVAGNATKSAIDTYPVGGLLYSSVNFQGKEQIKKMLYSTQQYSVDRIGTTMFFAVQGTGEENDPMLALSEDVNMVILPENYDGDTAAYRQEGRIPVIGTISDDSQLVLSENLSAEEVTSQYSAGEAAVAAVQAGADLLYLPEDFKEAYQAVLDAVNTGTISAERIDQSVGRILTQKATLPEITYTEEENTQESQSTQTRQPASDTQSNTDQQNQAEQTPEEEPPESPEEQTVGPDQPPTPPGEQTAGAEE
ncbi:MAG: glycoside hydrolase family 3 N-terminal domain-containing protein [Roseburia sp.]